MSDFEIHGDLRKNLEETAAANGMSVAHLIETALRRSFGLEPLDSAVEVQENRAINGGNNGFHAMTLVFDGYGNVIAEDMFGEELAKVTWDGDTPDATDALRETVRKAVVGFAHTEALETVKLGEPG